MSGPKTQNTKNQWGLGFVPSVVAEIRPKLSRSSATDCCFKLQTFSASPRLTLPPELHSWRFAVTLFMESRGAGVRGVTKDEALNSRKLNKKRPKESGD